MTEMKTILCALLVSGLSAYSAVAGSDPTNNPSINPSIFKLLRVDLEPDTFIVTLMIETLHTDLFYGIQAHAGPPVSNAVWHVLHERLSTGATLTFIDDVSGSLTHTGKTYRGFITQSLDAPTNQWITTANEEFIAYPFLSSPKVAMEMTGSTNELLITYGEGIYSNRVQCPIPVRQTVGYFRMYSTNNDPADAIIQMSTNLEKSIWSDVSGQ